MVQKNADTSDQSECRIVVASKALNHPQKGDRPVQENWVRMDEP